LPDIKHLVVLMMENHSFDNVLGSLDASGVAALSAMSNPDQSGAPVYGHHLRTTCQENFGGDQSWDGSHQSWDSGANDGFVRVSGADAMGYYTADDLPVTHFLARNFAVCDRWFASTLCQTYPNRQFLLAGTSQGNVKTDSQARLTATEPDNGTVFDLLDRYGITWKDYFADLASIMLWPTVFERYASYVRPVEEFFADCAIPGGLPFFSLIDPEAFEASEENPQNVQLGESYVWKVVDAVVRSPDWASTLLLLTYDEHGGYFDHVPPPSAPRPDHIDPIGVDSRFYGDKFSYLGFRVPTVAISPWVRPASVSHTVFDHTSVLSFIERKWNLPALTHRDGWAADMTDLLDSSAHLGVPALPAPPNLVAGEATCLENGETGISSP